MSHDSTAYLFAALESGSSELAYEFEGSSLSWAELDRRARSYAKRLADAGVGFGDRVAVYAETSLELIVALFGHYYLGAVHVPINTRYRAAELAHILRDAQPRAVLGDLAGAAVLEQALAQAGLERPPIRVAVEPGAVGLAFAELVAESDAGSLPGAEFPRPRDQDLALLIYTSGTTGPSKGVMLTHAAVVANIRALTQLWTWSRRDRLVLALPLFHVHGLCVGVHGAAIQQLPILLERRFDPASVVARFADHEHGNASLFMGVPTMYAAIVEYIRDRPEAAATLARGRLFTAGSAALSADLWREFVELTDQRILERYGMSETLITLSNPFSGVRKPGSVGLPVPGCAAAIVDDDGRELGVDQVGELIVESNGIMSGYWNLPQATSATFVRGRDGRPWFRTGDVATVDANGYFHVVGRKSVDILKSGGFKISAREIEDILAKHPDVAEVAVIGLPDPKWGEQIVACVVPHDPSVDADRLFGELVVLARAQLADYKKPRGLYVCAELPRNALGKLQKHLLRELVERDGLTARNS